MLFIDLSVSRAHSVLFESYDLSDWQSFPKISCNRCQQLQAGVNLNAPLDSNHMTALMIACMMGNWDHGKFWVGCGRNTQEVALEEDA